MLQATGYYLNVYGQELDVFIIFNEPNDQPTVTELTKIATIVEQVIDESTDENDLNELRSELVDKVESCGLNCVTCGVQVIVQSL